MVDVRGDVLRLPHGTTPAAVMANKIKKYKPLASLCSWAGPCGLSLTWPHTPEDRFSRDVAHSYVYRPTVVQYDPFGAI